MIPVMIDRGLSLGFWQWDMEIFFSWVMVLKVGASLAPGLEKTLMHHFKEGAEKDSTQKEK